MAVVPVLVSLVLALIAFPQVVRALEERGCTRPNYRGAAVAHPAGIAIVAVAVVALPVLAILDTVTGADILPAGSVSAVVFVVGVALLGLADDLLGDRLGDSARGLRGHARALLRGRPSTGALKAGGTAALAAAVLAGRGLDPAELVLAASVLTLATHVFNLLDLRPGRSIKAFLLLGGGLALGSLSLEPLGMLGLFLGPIAVLLVPDVRERAMLGDTGAGAIGAVAGLWLVLALPALGQAIALLLLLAVTAYGEARSISALVQRIPALSRIDSLGRSHA